LPAFRLADNLWTAHRVETQFPF